MNAGNQANPFTLDGRTAVVTGASRGIGMAIAAGFLDAGASVVCLQRGTIPDALAQHAEERSRGLHHVPVDLHDAASIAEAIENTLAAHRVDILVNNAGIQARYDAIDFPLDEFDAVMAVNTRAVFQLCQGFGRGMLERSWGRIITIASLMSFQGGMRIPAYAASKGAVAQLTKALANEWASSGVNVNAIAPGYVRTEINVDLFADPERSEQLAVRIPAGRWGTPGDIAGAATFLASDAAAYVHGVVLPVDGGWLGR